MSLVWVVLFACLSLVLTAPATADELDLRLKGVSLSRYGPMALIDHRVVEPGDHIGEVEIREIRKFSVIVRSRGQDYVLRLGSDGRPQPYVATAPTSPDPTPAVAGPTTPALVPAVAAAAPPQVSSERSVPAAPAPTVDTESKPTAVLAHGISPDTIQAEDRVAHDPRPSSSIAPGIPPGRTRVHRVVRGDTLAGIVADYYGSATPMATRAMVALYDVHPEAFGADMNVLFEGARLRMPDENMLSAIDAEAARAEVERHVARWRLRAEDPEIARVERTSETRFLPVALGETLAAVAARERPTDVTLAQMMLVVFAANPHAFGGNINLLFAGETLRIPPMASTDAPSPEHAAAEVRRQMALWQERDMPIEASPEATPFAALTLSSH